jgi:hypothetical protein
MLRAARLLHVIKPDRSVNSDCEVAADFRIDARNEKLCEKSLIAEALQTNCFAWGDPRFSAVRRG